VIGALTRQGLIDSPLRMPQAGAPFRYVATRRSIETLALGAHH